MSATVCSFCCSTSNTTVLIFAPCIGSDPIKAVLSSTGDVTVIQTVEVIPVGTVPPFWITMIIEPYLFYTMSPWFKIPGEKSTPELVFYLYLSLEVHHRK